MDLKVFWQYDVKDVIVSLQTSTDGLSATEAAKRLAANSITTKVKSPILADILLFLSQFKSPLVLLLVAAVILSGIMGETSDVFIISFIYLKIRNYVNLIL